MLERLALFLIVPDLEMLLILEERGMSPKKGRQMQQQNV